MSIPKCSQEIPLHVPYVDPQSRDFVCLSLVDKHLFNVCGEINPIINKEVFYKKFFKSFLGFDYITRLNTKGLEQLCTITEKIRKGVFKIFVEPYSPISVPIRGGCKILGRGFSLMMEESDCYYGTQNSFEPRSYEDLKFVTAKLLSFFRFNNIPCAMEVDIRDYYVFDESFLQTSFVLTFHRDLSIIDVDYPFPPEEKHEMQPNRLKAPSLRASFDEQNFTDCTIECLNGHSFGAHRFILTSSLEGFKKMFDTSMSEQTSRKIVFPEEIGTVKAFIAYFYNAMDPFEQSGADLINAVDLFAIAHRYGVEDLLILCQTHIAKNASEEDWYWLAQLGLLYKNTYFLKVSNCLRLRQGKSLPLKMKAQFKELGLPYHTFASQEVCVQCELKKEHTLSIRFSTNNTLGWGASKLFTQTEKGWVGRVPLLTEFKFVCISPEETTKWENRKKNRCLLDNVYLTIRNVAFF